MAGGLLTALRVEEARLTIADVGTMTLLSVISGAVRAIGLRGVRSIPVVLRRLPATQAPEAMGPTTTSTMVGVTKAL